MTITTTILYEDAERQEIEVVDDVSLTTAFRTIWKPGSVQANASDLTTKAQTALSANATFLAIASPSNAQLAAQVRLLTRQSNGVIRLLLGQLDTTDNT